MGDRNVGITERSIPFTQYSLPDGRTKEVETSDPAYTDEVLDKAQQIIDAGFRFEIEMLSDYKHVSITISDDDDDYVLVVALNGPDVPEAIVKAIKAFNIHENKVRRAELIGEDE